MSNDIVVEVAYSKEARATAHNFITETYKDTFNTAPSAPHILITAKKQGHVVGTVGLDVANREHGFRLEQIYTFNKQTTPLPYNRDLLVEYGRWTAAEPYTSPILLYAATKYARLLGKKYGWCEHRKNVHRIARQLGITFHHVEDAELLREKIPPGDRAFYTTVSHPSLYMVSIRESELSLERYVRNLEMNRKFSVTYFLEEHLQDEQAVA